MSNPLDDLFSEADKQLQMLEAESQENNFAQAADQEVDRETVLENNRNSASSQDTPSKMVHPVVRVMAVIFGVVALGFFAIGGYALIIQGWSWHVFSVTLAMATLATIFITGGVKGPGKLPIKGYSLLGGP